jgi:hypothetical protein
MTSDEWSPDEPLGTETYRQGDVAEDEDERLDPGHLEDLEVDPSLDPTLLVDDRELEELGAQLDDPERLVSLEGGMDDPDGLDEPPREPARADDEGWDLSAPLARRGPGEDDTEGDDRKR